MRDPRTYSDYRDGTADFYIVKTIKMMMYLVRKGYDVLKVEDSYENSNYKVFMFLKTPELKRDAEEYINNR